MNQLVLRNTQQHHQEIFKKIPLGYVVDVLKEGFKREVDSPESPIDIVDIYRALKRTQSHIERIEHGIFKHELSLSVDTFNDFLKWGWYIKIKNSTVKIKIAGEVFDPYNYYVTGRMFISYMMDSLKMANRRITKFNEISSKQKPKFPIELPAKRMIETFLKFSNGENGLALAEALGQIKRIPLTKNKSVVLDFEVFNIPENSWSKINYILKVTSLGIGFSLVRDKMTYYNKIEIPGFYENLLKRLRNSIKEWNFVVEGGVKKSKIKNHRVVR